MLISKTRNMHALPLSALTFALSFTAAVLTNDAEATDLKLGSDKVASATTNDTAHIHVIEEQGQSMTLADVLVDVRWRQTVAGSLRERQESEASEGLGL